MDEETEQARRRLPRWPRVVAYGALFIVLSQVLTPERAASNGDPDAAAANNVETLSALAVAVIVTGLAALLIEAALRTFARRQRRAVDGYAA